VSCGSTAGTTRSGPSRFDLYTCADAFTTGTERYYRFSPAFSGSVTAQLTQAQPGMSLAILRAAADGSCNIEDCIGAGPDLTFAATAGETYFIAVDGPDGEDGAHVLELACP
jgi:hypothetical protein